MQHFRDLDGVQINNSWATVGVFDGVHLGHQAIIQHLVKGARDAACASVVVTFFPHPAVVLGRNNYPSYLTSPEQRAALLGELGVDAVITLTFDRELASQTAEEFIQRLQEHIHLERLCVGADFALGRGREGDIPRLREIGQRYGYEVEVIDAVLQGSERISSSQIRRLITEGDLQAAAGLLGRNFRVDGTVVHGDGRGKLLGFPTANIEYWQEHVMPASGVYATWTWVDGQRLASVSNLGTRPTFENAPPVPRLEAHILDFEQDLYGRTLQVEFVERLRPEVRFLSVEALVEQVHKDMETAREVLAHAA